MKMKSAEFIVQLMVDLKSFHEDNDRKAALGKDQTSKTKEEWQPAFISYLQLRWCV